MFNQSRHCLLVQQRSGHRPNRMHAHLWQSGVPPADDVVARRLWLQQAFAYAALWLSLLHVVAEGWAELNLRDEVVDSLLASPHRDLLRRFRNGAFHFQTDYFDARFMDFLLSEEEPLLWAKSLHRYVGEWFLKRAAESGVVIPNEP